jgi:hypothetical protein
MAPTNQVAETLVNLTSSHFGVESCGLLTAIALAVNGADVDSINGADIPS